MQQPVNSSDRIHSLDFLRGFALLGILLMNINAFGHAGTAYLNPLVGPGLEGLNFHIWNFNWLFSEMRFISIFSMLFGAGMMLFTQNLRKKGIAEKKWQHRRMFFLLLFGLIHAYFIWAGDILVAYSICGSFVFLFRNSSDKKLIKLGLGLWIVPVILTGSLGLLIEPEDIQELLSFWSPDPDSLNAQIEAFRGSYFDQVPYRFKGAIALETVVFAVETFWQVSGLMMLGIVLFRSGVLSGGKSTGFYLKMTGIGLGIGMTISVLGLLLAYHMNWEGGYMMTFGRKFNYVASLFVSMGYVGIIMLVHKLQWLLAIQKVLRSVGRMAFTNYILMSVLCLFVFSGMGFGLYAKLDRPGLLFVVLGIWAVLLIISPVILKKYRFGPLEWLWRRLTYGEIFPKRKQEN